MMTAKQFHKSSGVVFRRARSPIVKDIVNLLQEYEKSKSENRKMKCVVYLYLMCKQYLLGKPDGVRADAVKSLMTETRTILDSSEFKRQIGLKAGGRHYSGGRKMDVGSTGGATSTSLAPGYGFEGILPQKNFIRKMRLNMDSVLGSDKRYYGTSLVAGSMQTDLMETKGLAADAAEKQAVQMLQTMPMSQVLDRIHDMWRANADGDFNYLSSGQRAEYLVTIRNGRMLRYADDAALDTGERFGKPNLCLYAMDVDERLYCPSNAKGVGINWNHSSMLSGHPVICAGEVAVKSGRLIEINNNSGHYKPDSTNLADCVSILINCGLNANGFKVEDKNKGQTYNTAQQFLTQCRLGGMLMYG